MSAAWHVISIQLFCLSLLIIEVFIMLSLAKPALDTMQPALPTKHVTLAQVYSSLKDMRRYTLRSVYNGRAAMLNLEPMPYKQAMIMRSKYSYYPNRSIEIIRLH